MKETKKMMCHPSEHMRHASITKKVEDEMETINDVQTEMAKAGFISQCEKNMVVTLPLLLRISKKKMILQRY